MEFLGSCVVSGELVCWKQEVLDCGLAALMLFRGSVPLRAERRVMS